MGPYLYPYYSPYPYYFPCLYLYLCPCLVLEGRAAPGYLAKQGQISADDAPYPGRVPPRHSPASSLLPPSLSSSVRPTQMQSVSENASTTTMAGSLSPSQTLTT